MHWGQGWRHAGPESEKRDEWKRRRDGEDRNERGGERV